LPRCHHLRRPAKKARVQGPAPGRTRPATKEHNVYVRSAFILKRQTGLGHALAAIYP
jgi:hypothetical protein